MNFLKNSSSLQRLILYGFSMLTLFADFIIVFTMYVSANNELEMQSNFYEAIFLVIIVSSIVMAFALLVHFILGFTTKNNSKTTSNDYKNDHYENIHEYHETEHVHHNHEVEQNKPRVNDNKEHKKPINQELPKNNSEPVENISSNSNVNEDYF